MRMKAALTILACGLGSLTACSSDKVAPGQDAGPTGMPDAGTMSGASSTTDAGTTIDASSTTDAETTTDASSTSDAAPPSDASSKGDAAPASDGGPGSDGGSTTDGGTLTLLDLDDVKTNPSAYAFFDFKPNVKKLILTGAAETQHIAVLWYTTQDGGVALHYHSKTESVFVIDGTQTDAKGIYPTGTVYFNPPGSGHQITDSTGFFLLAYAAPPDFASTNLIEAYTPIRIDTTDANLTSTYPFEQKAAGVKTYSPGLVSTGGMSAELIETTSVTSYPYQGNYVLVLEGSCDINGMTATKDKVVVTSTIEPQPYAVAAVTGESCLAMGISF
ncbi:MAG TPA: cupin domain-containing protein [Polyangiaceae bacterium]|nr:cupin domain-containing protein [Polyangiaceae bacterium]